MEAEDGSGASARGGTGQREGKGAFDLETEVDLFAAQLSAQLRAVRQHTMIIADKTIANVMAYAWLVLQTRPAVARPTGSSDPRARPSGRGSSTCDTAMDHRRSRCRHDRRPADTRQRVRP